MIPTGVLFDLDGTLLDSELTHFELCQEVARTLGYSLTQDQYDEFFRGKADYEVFVEMAEGREDQVSDAISKKQQAFLERLKSNQVPPVPGAVEFVRQLTEQNVKLGVVTSATRAELLQAIENLGCSDCFDVLVSAESVTLGKPNPEPYEKAAILLGVPPHECLVYEDSVAGIVAADAAGMNVVAVGPRNDTGLAAGAMIGIPDFREHRLPGLPKDTY
jgi:HAD superfamily hydrolase (TIGR01509 family)